MAEETPNVSWRPRFLSEYSMGELDFQRFNQTLTHIDFLSSEVNSTHLPSLELMQKFFAELINLYDDFRPLISIGTITADFDNIITKGIKIKRRWEDAQKSGTPMNQFLIFNFIDLCRTIKTKLYSIKQVIGLGIVVKKNLSTQEKIKMGMGRMEDKKYTNLPEP